MYRKPHTKTQYLRTDSAHARFVTANIPKSLIHRVVRISSIPGAREIRLEELRSRLLVRGYKNKSLDQAFMWGLSLDREDAIKKVVRGMEVSNRVRYTATYDPKLPSLPPILVKNWKVMVDTDRRLVKPFAAPPMACLKRPVNLSDQLIRSRLSTLQRAGTRVGQVGFRRCPGSRRGCSLCPFTGAAADGKSVVKEVRVNNTGQVINVI